MKPKHDPRKQNGHKRRQIREAIRRRRDPCALCGCPIDYDLPAGHPLSFEVDEIIPVSKWREFGYPSAVACALDIKNCQPSHRICNQRKGNKIIKSKAMKPASGNKPLTLPLSRRW